MRAGANGYVTKDAPVARVVAALRGASSGLVVMGPEEAISVAGTVEMPSRGDHGGRADLPTGRGETSGRTEPARTNGDDGGDSTTAGEATHDALTPRGKAGYQYAEVWVDQSTGMPVQTRVTERNGDSTLVRLTNIERNPNIPTSTFDISLPSGVKVVKG